MHRRWLSWIVLAVVLAVALAIGSGTRPGSATVSQRVDRIARDVRCPSCSGLSVAESDAPTAIAVRQLITDRVKAGRSDDSIDAELVHSYGSGILLRPPASGVAAVVWVAPDGLVVARLLGAVTAANLDEVLARARAEGA